MSEPAAGPAAALGGATIFGLFTGTDFGIVFGALAGALLLATMPQALSAWRVAAHFLVSFIVGVLGAHVLSAWIASKTGYDGTSADALCAVLVAVVSVKVWLIAPAGCCMAGVPACSPACGWRRRQC